MAPTKLYTSVSSYFVTSLGRHERIRPYDPSSATELARSVHENYLGVPLLPSHENLEKFGTLARFIWYKEVFLHVYLQTSLIKIWLPHVRFHLRMILFGKGQILKFYILMI
ncbi:hypothetical protein ACJX0J_028888 [Zea mays]